MSNQDAVLFLADEWHGAGVHEGDVLLIHSSLRRTFSRLKEMGCEVSPEIVLDSFLEAIGPRGTLLLPLFNFDFTKGVQFDVRSTPSQMGALTEAARRRPGMVRTGHPIYSLAVLGDRRESFEGVENFSGYGADSPFGILHRLGGKIAVLDLPDQNSITFYHYVEENRDVSYRYHKTFTGEYVGWSGKVEIKTFGLFVRDLEQGVLTHVDPMGEILWSKGLYSGSRPNEGYGLRVIDSRALFDTVAEVIDAGRAHGLLYRITAKND